MTIIQISDIQLKAIYADRDRLAAEADRLRARVVELEAERDDLRKSYRRAIAQLRKLEALAERMGLARNRAIQTALDALNMWPDMPMPDEVAGAYDALRAALGGQAADSGAEDIDSGIKRTTDDMLALCAQRLAQRAARVRELEAALKHIREMAEEDTRSGHAHVYSNVWQIEADARAALGVSQASPAQDSASLRAALGGQEAESEEAFVDYEPEHTPENGYEQAD